PTRGATSSTGTSSSMRISAGVLVLAACATAPPAPEPHPDACADYGAAVQAPLARMAQAADRYSDRMPQGPDAAARAGRELAAALDGERRRLAEVAPARGDIAEAHDHMLAAVDSLAAAIRFLSEALAFRDETRREPARARLRAAELRWKVAVEDVRKVCP